MSERYFEDFEIGQRFGSGTTAVTADGIKAFAREFDPQPFHLDPVRARDSLFGGLVASGWHTMAMTMRLIVESEMNLAGGVVGGGAEELRWPAPVRPGDVLHIEIEVLERRVSRSRPEIGIMKVRVTTFNQGGEVVQLVGPTLITRRRPADAGTSAAEGAP